MRTLRIVDPNLATREDAQRFTACAETLLQLDHPNVVRGLDLGTLKGGVPYLLTEYVPAGTLARGLARNGALAPRSASLLILEIADALVALHQLGLVHREISAEHVLLDPNGAARVTDFDLSLREGQVSRRMAGVAAYRAPEQIAAEADPSRGPPADKRTDVFAVGVLLWTVLCGEVPRAIQRLHSDPNIFADVEPALTPILVQSLGFHAEDRYPSMEPFAEALMEALAVLPEEDTPRLVLPPEEQAVTQHVAELGRVADSSTDQTPAWLEDRPSARPGTDPFTHPSTPSGGRILPAGGAGAGKSFTPARAAPTPSGKTFESPPPLPAQTPERKTGTLRIPSRPETQPPPPLVETIGAPPQAPPAEDVAPTWLERWIVPVAAGIGALAVGAIVAAIGFGLGMVRVERAHSETERAQQRLLDLMDQQRRVVEQGANEGADPEIEQTYLVYTQQRREDDRLNAASAFIATVVRLDGPGGPGVREDDNRPGLAVRQLVTAESKLHEARGRWKEASDSWLGQVAIGIGLASGYED